MSTNTDLYKQDLARWGQETAALLRAGPLREVDLEAVAEELDSLGRGDSHRLWEHLRELLAWFLAWNYTPAQRLQVVYLSPAAKYDRLTCRPSQGQKGLDERAIMASQWPSHPR